MPKLSIDDLKKIKEDYQATVTLREGGYRAKVTVHMGTCGIAAGARKVMAALMNEIAKKNVKDIIITTSGCAGLCSREPMATIELLGKPPVMYSNLDGDKIRQIFTKHVIEGNIVDKYVLDTNIDFFKLQKLIALQNRGILDAEKIDEYIARDGYIAAGKALLEMTPEEIIQVIKDSGLRGRGGAGFPTGLKWEFCYKAKGDEKFILCNGDEGDPGAFMDRSILEADPHAVLEGMIIGAKAIGAHKGYIYVRAEYPLAVKRLGIAIDQAIEYGLLGKDILGSGFDLDIEIYQGAGAFVCGEETALMTSIEGRRGMPRPRPPFPAHKGLWQKPSVLNNVETFANIPQIILNGADWYASLGTEKSKGTKVFALTGAVNNIGLIEVPMGIPLRKIIFDIGGGIKNKRKFKAVQIGGPSGGCIPESFLDTPVDYESITKTGAIMGSGGMVVMDETACMVSIAKFFLEFTQEESCGKCVPCRIGTKVMLDKLEDITAGQGQEGDIELLEDLAEDIKNTSLCGLGQTAPNPVLTTIKYFRDEYEAHIKYKRCPAVVCKSIISSACQHTCPLGQDVSCYIGLIAQEKFDEAIKIVHKENPFPAICGRVCHHPCELKCRAGEVNEPIAIRSLKRFLADYEQGQGIKIEEKPKKKRAEKVAIIGSGPGGLTCAYYLALEGYQVTVFEALSVIGGMLRVGIPEYRLPKKILDYEIQRIKNLGVEIRTNTTIGKDIQLSELKNQGYKAIFIATGAHKGLKMGIPGEDTIGVIDAVDFLRQVNLGQRIEIGEKVMVIGGGNAAVDAARVAKRLGKEVRILYRRTRQEMPAAKEEVEATIQEGIPIDFLAAPVKINIANGKLKDIECIKMKLGDVDESGRRKPVPIEGSEFKIEIDTLIPAIGQQPDISFLNGNRIKVSRWNTIEVDAETFSTTEEGIFAGGDVVTGPKTVTEAMAAGKVAAKMMHKYLQGEEVKREYEVTRPAIHVEPVKLTVEELEKIEKKPSMPSLPVNERIDNFNEVELGYTREMAIQEAKRCLRCDYESTRS